MARANTPIGPYQLLKFLGRGGYGEVWHAVEDTGLSRMEVALKLIGAANGGGVDLDEVRREVALWHRAGKHPNVITLIKADVYDTDVVIVSEYADGGTLQKWLDDNGGKAPSLAEAMWMARGVLAGLDHIHRLASPILHRDLKPDNILLDGPDKRPKLGDFGSATGLTTKHTNNVAGTFGYIPPEAFASQKEPQSDIWAVGAIIYKMLSGRLPFTPLLRGSYDQRALAMLHAFKTPPPPLPADVPMSLQAVVMKALALNYGDRYATAQAMLQALEEALATPDQRQPKGKPLPVNDFRPFAFVTPMLDDTGKVMRTPQFTARSYVDRIGGVELEMVEIPGGSFDMGSTEAQAKAAWEDAKRYNKDASWEWFSWELQRKQKPVTVPPFFFGKGAVTQGQWRAVAKLPEIGRVLDLEPSCFKGDDRLPVEQVSWHDAQEFCARLTAATGRAYRLPSEAEWEYACRAGTKTPFPFGETITPDLVNYDSNYPYANAPKDEKAYRRKTIPVFSGKANPCGLYNICGNVWEWCEDIWKDNYDGLPLDGSANVSVGDSGFRVLRGGSWDLNAWDCRSARRTGFDPARRLLSFGFRVAASPAR